MSHIFPGLTGSFSLFHRMPTCNGSLPKYDKIKGSDDGEGLRGKQVPGDPVGHVQLHHLHDGLPHGGRPYQVDVVVLHALYGDEKELVNIGGILLISGVQCY